jgi:uncharacterized membrane protein
MMAQIGLLLALAVLLLSIVMAHRIARRKGRNAVFWGLMASIFGPFILPVVILLKPLPPASHEQSSSD